MWAAKNRVRLRNYASPICPDRQNRRVTFIHYSLLKLKIVNESLMAINSE